MKRSHYIIGGLALAMSMPIQPSSPNHPIEGYNNDPHGRCGTRI